VVAIEFATTSWDSPLDSIGFAAQHADWIDVQSNSWYPTVPVYEPTGVSPQGTPPHFIAEVERVSAAMPAFWASGNGAANSGGALGHPTFLTPHATPSAIMVGGHDSGYVNVWPGFPPHLVSDSCGAWRANSHSVDTSDDSGPGTSVATPYVAGGGARILAQARALLGDTGTGKQDGTVMASGDPGDISAGPLADGVLTREEWQRVLYTTATPRPEAQFEDGSSCVGTHHPYTSTPVRWADVPDGYPEYVHIGYGAVDDPAIELEARVLRGETPLPNRTATDEYFAAHHTIGGETHELYTTLAG